MALAGCGRIRKHHFFLSPGRENFSSTATRFSGYSPTRVRAADARKWQARRSFAHIRRHLGGPGRGLFGGDLVFRRRALEFLEGELHLVVQAGGTFRTLTTQRLLQLPDRQILMCDQRRIIRCLGLGDRQFGLDQRSVRGLVFGSGQRRGQLCPQRADMVRNSILGGGNHALE